jgi:hypothetical protein
MLFGNYCAEIISKRRLLVKDGDLIGESHLEVVVEIQIRKLGSALLIVALDLLNHNNLVYALIICL